MSHTVYIMCSKLIDATPLLVVIRRCQRGRFHRLAFFMPPRRVVPAVRNYNYGADCSRCNGTHCEPFGIACLPPRRVSLNWNRVVRLLHVASCWVLSGLGCLRCLG